MKKSCFTDIVQEVFDEKRDKNWAVRIPSSLRARLKQTHQTTGMWPTDAVNRLIEAYVLYVEKHGEITAPFVVVPRLVWEKTLLLAQQSQDAAQADK